MISHDPSLEDMAAVLDKAKIRGDELRCCCPAHGGEDPNCSIAYRDGKLLAWCHSHQCSFEEIIAAIRERLGESSGAMGEVVDITHNGKRISERKSKAKNDAVRDRTTWKIRDGAGKIVALHVRDDLADGDKKCWWRLPSGKTGLGDKGTADLPLYGAEDASRTPAGSWVVVTEGEKAADALRGARALREAGMSAVGTVTGASGTPGPDALSVLRGLRVVLWPDNDGPGFEHMGRIAEALGGIAEEVRWFEWEEAPEKGDAADHPDVDSLADSLKLAPRWSRSPAIPGRMLLGHAIELGVEPPEELLPDMLLAAKAHNFYAPGGVGKTWLLVWIATELVRRGKRVVVFDVENGLRTYAERFEEMGADPKMLDDLLHYYPFPVFDKDSYVKMLDEDQPDIVMFDSWIGFLAADGRDENVSNDISAWAEAYSKPALRRGCAVAVLDHVPHEHERERGSSRKRDEMDVVWKLTKIGDFDRDRTATLSMTRQKDREGWLPEKLTFEIGGDPTTGEFVMRRDDSLARKTEVTHLNTKERRALNALKTFGAEGAKTSEWLIAVNESGEEISKPTLHRIRRDLVRKGKVTEDGSRYTAIDTQDVGGVSGVSEVYHDTLDISPNHRAPGGVSGVSLPLKGVTTHYDTPPSAASPVKNGEGVSNSDTPDTGPVSGGLGARLRKIRDERRNRDS